MQIGEIIPGKVTSVTDYGLFATANGLDFLLLLHELSWRRIGRRELFASGGDIVEFKIILLADPDGHPRRRGSPEG